MHLTLYSSSRSPSLRSSSPVSTGSNAYGGNDHAAIVGLGSVNSLHCICIKTSADSADILKSFLQLRFLPDNSMTEQSDSTETHSNSDEPAISHSTPVDQSEALLKGQGVAEAALQDGESVWVFYVGFCFFWLWNMKSRKERNRTFKPESSLIQNSSLFNFFYSWNPAAAHITRFRRGLLEPRFRWYTHQWDGRWKQLIHREAATGVSGDGPQLLHRWMGGGARRAAACKSTQTSGCEER